MEWFLEASKQGQIGRPAAAGRYKQETKRKEPAPKRRQRTPTIVKHMPRLLGKGPARIKCTLETQPRKVTPTMRLWEGAWTKDAVISYSKLKNAL